MKTELLNQENELQRRIDELKNYNSTIMRKILFKKWIPAIMDKNIGGLSESPRKGTRCWEDDYVNEGTFHQWANAYEESSEGFGNYTVALIELADGTIVEVLPANIKFVEPITLHPTKS